MKHFVAFLSLCFVLMVGPALADTFTLGGKVFTVTPPPGWKGEKGLFDIPLALLGPLQRDRTRGVLSLSGPDIKTTKTSFSPEFKKELDKQFRDLKRNWLSKNDGKLIDFLPMEEKPGADKATQIVALGLTYEHRGKSKIEKSYYIACGGHFLMGKLVLTHSNHFYLADVEKSIQGLTCK